MQLVLDVGTCINDMSAYPFNDANKWIRRKGWEFSHLINVFTY